MILTVFGLLVVHGVDSGAVMEAMLRRRFRSCYGGFGFYDHSDIMTKMVWSQDGHIKRRLLYHHTCWTEMAFDTNRKCCWRLSACGLWLKLMRLPHGYYKFFIPVQLQRLLELKKIPKINIKAPAGFSGVVRQRLSISNVGV